MASPISYGSRDHKGQMGGAFHAEGDAMGASLPQQKVATGTLAKKSPQPDDAPLPTAAPPTLCAIVAGTGPVPPAAEASIEDRVPAEPPAAPQEEAPPGRMLDTPQEETGAAVSLASQEQPAPKSPVPKKRCIDGSPEEASEKCEGSSGKVVKEEAENTSVAEGFSFTQSEACGHIVYAQNVSGPESGVASSAVRPTHEASQQMQTQQLSLSASATPTQLASTAPGAPRSKKELPCCLVCTRSRANAKVAFCQLHRNANDNLNNMEVHLKRKYGEESQQYIAYVKSWKEGATVAKHAAIIQYARLYLSDSSGAKQKGGTRKGEFDFVGFQHSVTKSAIDEDDDAFWKADYEAFSVRMEHVRKWSSERSQDRGHWKSLGTDLPGLSLATPLPPQ
eukprot:5320136-Amphidinium_carterae.1